MHSDEYEWGITDDFDHEQGKDAKNSMDLIYAQNEHGKRNRRKLDQPRRINNTQQCPEVATGMNNSVMESDSGIMEHHPKGSPLISTDVDSFIASRGRLRVRECTKTPCAICGLSFTRLQMATHLQSHAVEVRTSPRRIRAKRPLPKKVKAKTEDASGRSKEKIRLVLPKVARKEPSASKTSVKRRPRFRKYRCYVCDRLFTKDQMAKHLRTHSDSDAKSAEGPCKTNSGSSKREAVDGTDGPPDVGGAADVLDGVGESVLASEEDSLKPEVRNHSLVPCDVCGCLFSKYYLAVHRRLHGVKQRTRRPKPTKNAGVKTNVEPEGCNNNNNSVADDSRTPLELGDRGTIKVKRRRKKFPCDVCGAMFTKYYMKVHERSHTGEKPFTCEECVKCFTTISNLKAHVLSCHKGSKVKAVQCDICSRTLCSKASLKQHVRTHSDEKPFQCKVCGKSFKQSPALTIHARVHMDGMPYQCEACGRRYKSVQGLILHRRFHHEGVKLSFPCDLCDKVFTRRTKLKDHIMWHNGTSPYMCEYCGKRLLSRKTLRTHVLIHEDKKPYECSVCGKSFRQNCVLKRHMSVHTGVKPFSCEHCGKQFIHRVYLVKHTCMTQRLDVL